MPPAWISCQSAIAISGLTVLAAGTTTSILTPRGPSPASNAHVMLTLESRSRLGGQVVAAASTGEVPAAASAGDADAALEPGRVPRVAQARHLHHVTGVRRVYELAAADVDADVA